MPSDIDTDTKPQRYYAELAPGVPFPETPGDKTKYEVQMLGPDDPENPLNWPSKKKGILLMAIAYVIMVAAWGSSVIAPTTEIIARKYHIGLATATLGVSLYVVGFAVGPIVWGPLSVAMGRKPPLLVGSFGLMLFMWPAATSKDIQTLIICRFFQGVFGASSLSIGPAVAGDVFTAKFRGTAISIVTFCVVAGPMVAPIVGAYITQSYLGWRWVYYITGIMSALACIMILFLIPETFVPKILNQRAAYLRETTGNWAIRGPGDLAKPNFKEIVNQVLLSPIKMLFVEPILMLVTLYHGMVYGILYLCLSAVPIIFHGYGFPGANVFLPYVALLTGAIIVNVINVIYFEPQYNKALEKSGKSVLPEKRLPLMMLSGIMFTIGIFFMCWSGAYPQDVHWIVPMVGSAFLSFGMIGIFVAAFNYILDVYLMKSGIAFAANTFLRSAFGCAFPLFAHPLFINLGIQWAGTLLGCLSALLIPVPFLFYCYGAKLRGMSKFAASFEQTGGADSDVYSQADPSGGFDQQSTFSQKFN